MDNNVYIKFLEAKKTKNLYMMQDLYNDHPNELFIKFEYAKLLIINNKKYQGKKILLSMLNTQNKNYAILELGRLEKEEGNIELSRNYFKQLLNTQNKNYAILELGRLEKEEGNIELSRNYFKQLLNTTSKTYAILELGRLEKEEGNIELSRNYFKQLLNTTSKTYAILELGRLEKEEGNIELSRNYFKQLLNTTSKTYAILELGRLEKEKGNIELSRNYFKQLLNTQNKNYAILELGRLEKEEGNIELSRNYFKQLLNTPSKKYSINLLILLEILEKNLISALEYINLALKEKITINQYLLVYISKELNIFFNMDYSKLKYNYSLNQLLDYDEFLALDHITDRHINNSRKDNFNVNIDIYKLFNDVGNLLIKENKVEKLNFNNFYIVRMDNIGSNGENYLFVATLPNTKQILTMYPIKSKTNFNRYLEKYENEYSKVLVKK